MEARRRRTDIEHRHRAAPRLVGQRWAEPASRPRAFERPVEGASSGAAHPVPPVRVADSPYVRYVKPAIDRVAALLILVLTIPLMLAVALVVLLSLGRPVLYRQLRVGQGGRVFRVWKFRTMLPDRRVSLHPVAVERRVCHKRDDDPRHTNVGTVLRRWRLDELPQLMNVLAGSMSLVGPRPELVEVVSRYQPWQHQRHAVKPGITGPWQVSAPGCSGLMHENTHIDLAYVGDVGLRTDIGILIRTVRCLLARSGR